ncbi:aminotransferase class V-fold PLP-dependent enzyme [Paracoccaceae bacterium]|nr:aminotransferase class V-fold PLP-dependent enzyme [Paracoccaceae bacterium]
MVEYLDFASTTPVDPDVAELVMKLMVESFGNASSRTHIFGNEAKKIVSIAREQIASTLNCEARHVFFTSGATESNNLTIFGLANSEIGKSKKHIVSTTIEHEAVLEPLEELSKQGFEVELVSPSSSGVIEASDVISKIRPDTLLVSVMHVNNELGTVQPIAEIADGLQGTDAFFHVDAAQGYGKSLSGLTHERIDLISISGHKIFAPKGVGILIKKTRDYSSIKLKPLMFGGGQENGVRPGTLAVPLIGGIGLAAELAYKNKEVRNKHNKELFEKFCFLLESNSFKIIGDKDRHCNNILLASNASLDGEAAILALKDSIAISNGAACTSAKERESHVLSAIQLEEKYKSGVIRLSWCHLTKDIEWKEIEQSIANFL